MRDRLGADGKKLNEKQYDEKWKSEDVAHVSAFSFI